MRPRRLDARQGPRGPRPHRGRHRQQPRRVPPARPRLLRRQGHRLRVRPEGARGRRHRRGRRLRRRQQRRQLQHHLRPGRARDVRHRERRGPHLRPGPRRGLPAAGHPHRRDGALDRRPDAAPAAPPRLRARVARPVRLDPHRGHQRPGQVDRPQADRARDHRRQGRLPHPARRGHAWPRPTWCCRTATSSTS